MSEFQHTGIFGNIFRLELKSNLERFYFYLLSDLHIGSSSLNYYRLNKTLEEARSLNARILINGDVFDGILPKDMKRFQPSVLDRELQGMDDILSAVIDKGVRILEPYADLIDVIGIGNHEDSILRHHNINLVGSKGCLIDRLNAKGGNIKYGGYTGYLTYTFWRMKSKSHFSSTKFVIQYHHGAGGSAIVTKGILNLARASASNEGADIIWQAHKHNIIGNVNIKTFAQNSGNVDFREERWIMTGAFQNYTENSFAVRQDMKPQPHGGVKVEVWFSGSNRKKNVRITM